ncbi:MAG TPA: TlpA disulfide reductase family protein [Vicinamibacterales bacterium]|nr:TlpA disulfide reductase family protein [Vicinamibacterales bacterium]
MRAALALLIAAWFVVACVLPARGQTAPSAIAAGSQRRVAPDFSLTDAAGGRVTLSGCKGRVVLLDFWATWCTGCKVEIPWYIEFDRKYAAQGLTSIGAAMDDEGWAKVKPYLAEHPIPYSIVVGNPDLVQPYDIKNLPVTLLIDRHGRIADAHTGVVDKGTWEQEIRQLLRER